MSVLRNLEDKIAGLVEGTFGRVFRSEVRPVELARKLAKEMDEHRTVSVSRTYVPNEYVVWLSPEDRERYEGVEREVIEELGAYLLEHARRERVAMLSRPVIQFRTDDQLALGEFGIQARTVKLGGDDPRRPSRATTATPRSSPRATGSRPRSRRSAPRAPAAPCSSPRASATPSPRVARRSAAARDCDIVLNDSNVSRRHAELKPGPQGRWTIADLGSTNGIRVNGRDVPAGQAQPLTSGDHVTVGTVDTTFEVD